jgi:transcriptional regulator with XRE-family HTH domain
LTNAGRSGIETGMHYTQLFRQLRVARDLSHDALARLAGCHRNWLEAVSNIPFSRPETVTAARRQAGVYGRDALQTSRQLAEIVADARLSAEQIRLLMYAARRPEVLSIVATVRKLVEAGSAAEAVPELKVAEEE